MRIHTALFLKLLFTNVFSFLLIFNAQSQISLNSTDFPFMNSALPLQERVDNLVSQLTLEEKIVQMQHTSPAIDRLGIPQYNWWNECFLLIWLTSY